MVSPLMSGSDFRSWAEVISSMACKKWELAIYQRRKSKTGLKCLVHCGDGRMFLSLIVDSGINKTTL